jgi:cell division protein FtsB
LAGIIPIMLLLGGGLAIYLGFDELKDTWKKDEPAFESSSIKESEIEQYKHEIDELKDEIKSLKKD